MVNKAAGGCQQFNLLFFLIKNIGITIQLVASGPDDKFWVIWAGRLRQTHQDIHPIRFLFGWDGFSLGAIRIRLFWLSFKQQS
jgi:hypothetical protein